MKAFKGIDYAKDSTWWEIVKQSSNTMGLADWLVFAFCLGFPMAVGVYFMMQAKRAAAKNPGGAMEEYMMASKSAEVLPLALSIVTSFMSAITVLGVPGDVPASNTAYVWFLLTFTSVCALTALVYVPVFYNMEIKSTYEYLNRRFGNAMRLMGVVAFLVQTALYLGIVIYAPALALSKTTGLNLWGVVVGTGIVCIIYTTLGGMKAVIWTGVFQALVMFGGFFAIIIFGCYDMGWDEIWRINQEEHRLDIWDFSFDIRQKHTFWTILFAGQMVWLSLYATSQAQVQRYMSSKTLKDAQLAIGINVVGLWFINAAALACGMVIFGKRKELDKYIMISESFV